LATPHQWPGEPFDIGQGGGQMKNGRLPEESAFALAEAPSGGYMSPRLRGFGPVRHVGV